MSRNAIQWHQKPGFPDTHYVDTAIYTSDELFREEQAKIFGKCWIIACHESELPERVRLPHVPASRPACPLIVVRGEDMKVRAFYNICPHRGNTLLYDPVGNAKRITCIFHAWSFDTKGSCIDISRGKDRATRSGSARRGRRAARGARRRVGYGGFVWVNIDDESGSLQEYIGDALGMLEEHMNMPLEVFHYPQGGRRHELQAVARHEQRVLPRLPALLQSHHRDAAARVLRPQVHRLSERARVGGLDADQVRQVRRQQEAQRRLAGPRARRVDPDRHLPGHDLQPAHFGAAHGHRRSRSGPNKVAHRVSRTRPQERHAGASVQSASATTTRSGDRSAATCTRTCSASTARASRCAKAPTASWVIHGREENMTIHDEGGMRHFYAEWSRRMGRPAYDPFGTNPGANPGASPAPAKKLATA